MLRGLLSSEVHSPNDILLRPPLQNAVRADIANFYFVRVLRAVLIFALNVHLRLGIESVVHRLPQILRNFHAWIIFGGEEFPLSLVYIHEFIRKSFRGWLRLVRIPRYSP